MTATRGCRVEARARPVSAPRGIVEVASERDDAGEGGTMVDDGELVAPSSTPPSSPGNGGGDGGPKEDDVVVFNGETTSFGREPGEKA
jgi:hypothetical protein